MQVRLNEENKEPTQADLVERIDDWISRLTSLRQMVEGWLKEAAKSDLHTVDASSVKMREQLMQQFEIAERSMPSFKVMNGDEQLALFRPIALWVIGGNGRVDIFTAKEATILVDAAPHFQAPQWKLYRSKSPRDVVDFNKETFFRLLNLA